MTGHLSVDDALRKLPASIVASMPQPPPGVRDKSQVAMLRPGEEYMLDGAIRKVKMGLGWDAGCDVDASCVMLAANKGIVDVVSFKKLKSSDGSIKHSGDDRTGEGGGDDEVIKVALEKVPLHVHYLLFLVCVYAPIKYDFRAVRSCFVRMVHRKKFGKNPELARLNLSGGPGEAMALSCLVRKGSYWSMVSLGLPLQGRTADDVMRIPQQLQFLAPLQSFYPQLKNITVFVVEAKELVAKDSNFFGKDTSDPYYHLIFSGSGGKRSRVEVRSETIKKTVKPHWNMRAIPLGAVHASTHKMVKIRLFDEDTVSADDFLGEVRIPGGVLWNMPDGTCEGWFPLYPMFAAPPKVPQYPTKNVSGQLHVKWEVTTLPMMQ